MRVVQINAVSGTGSTGVIARHISDILNNHGIENYIFYAAGYDSYEYAVKISDNFDMKIHALMSHLTGKQAYFSKHSTRKLIKRLDDIQPDIVHLHNLHNNYINLNMLLQYLADKDIKTVITLHDCWFFTGKCTHYAFQKCNRWQDGCGNCPSLKADNPSWFFDRTAKIWADKKKYFEKIKRLEIVGVSEWIAGEARKSFLTCGNITCIHNGINTAVFTTNGADLRDEYKLGDKFVVLGMANKWQSTQNAGLLEYVSQKLDKDCVMLLVGGKTNGVDNIINIPYQTSPKGLAEVYRTADVLVNVTHADSLPTVNMEAMACGTPVITYDVCGSTEIITDNTGIVVSEGDKSALVDAVYEVKEKGKGKYSQSCIRHIADNYEQYTQFEKYLGIYRGEKV